MRFQRNLFLKLTTPNLPAIAMCWHCSYLASQALAGGGVHINFSSDRAGINPAPT